MKTMTILGAALLVLTACATGTNHDEGEMASSAEALTTQTDVPAGDATCPNGGTRIDSGADADGDGALDPDEVTASRVVCRRAFGAPRTVFVTSQAWSLESALPQGLGSGDELDAYFESGQLSATNFGDQKCQELADAVPALQGKIFKSFVSDLRAGAITKRLSTDGSFVRVDGVEVGDNFYRLFRDVGLWYHWFGDDSVLMAPISLDENGVEVDGKVYTATTRTGIGNIYPTGACASWFERRFGGADRGRPNVGHSKAKNDDWFEAETIDCKEPVHFYCFEQ